MWGIDIFDRQAFPGSAYLARDGVLDYPLDAKQRDYRVAESGWEPKP